MQRNCFRAEPSAEHSSVFGIKIWSSVIKRMFVLNLDIPYLENSVIEIDL